MKLAAGNITSVVKQQQIYVAEVKSEINFIFLSNESDSDITVNLFLQYEKIQIRLLPKDKVISNNTPIILQYPLTMEILDMIRISTNGPGLSYIIEGLKFTDLE